MQKWIWNKPAICWRICKSATHDRWVRVAGRYCCILINFCKQTVRTCDGSRMKSAIPELSIHEWSKQQQGDKPLVRLLPLKETRWKTPGRRIPRVLEITALIPRCLRSGWARAAACQRCIRRHALDARRLSKLARTPWRVCSNSPSTSYLDSVLVNSAGMGRGNTPGRRAILTVSTELLVSAFRLFPSCHSRINCREALVAVRASKAWHFDIMESFVINVFGNQYLWL